MSINFNVHSNNEHENALSRIAKGVVAAYDWLSGPAMSEQQRINHDLTATEWDRRIGPVGL
jgi:hypothetical protein